MLLAVDGNQRIVGANRTARTSLMLDDDRLRTGVSLWTVFERDPALFRRKDATDIPTQLVAADSDETWPALVTPPADGPAAWQQAESCALHTRPRLDSLATGRQRASHPPSRGGLPPGAVRRVREHVELHLSESMDLAELAGVAGLSLYHFARAFKQSTGVTPHHYLVHRRIERAREMLARSELPLSEIALAAGFSDQSHLARRFRQNARHDTGTVPLVTTLAAFLSRTGLIGSRKNQDRAIWNGWASAAALCGPSDPHDTGAAGVSRYDPVRVGSLRR